jgi:hypothetical protein
MEEDLVVNAIYSSKRNLPNTALHGRVQFSTWKISFVG